MAAKLFLIVLVSLCYRSRTKMLGYLVDSKNYTGKISMTYAGEQCQPWIAQAPHAHANNEDVLFTKDGSASDAKTYCRDPDGEGKPWCYTMNPKIRWQFCNVPICNVDCWIGTNSRLYYGLKSTTESGRQCQSWAVQKPQEHTHNKEVMFPLDRSASAAMNFCRDPDREGMPWCYTMDSAKRWEPCGIPKC